MLKFKPRLLVGFTCLLHTVSAFHCEQGWTAHKDEVCIKKFDELLTYDDARLFCASEGNDLSVSSLVTVKDAGIQEMLVNYTQGSYVHMWLGGMYDVASEQFLWLDGDPLTYSNWAVGFPRNITDLDMCMIMQPGKSKATIDRLDGKWEDGLCQRRSRVMCQRPGAWSLEEATREIRKLQKRDVEIQEQLNIAGIDRQQLQSQLHNANSEINDLRQQLNETSNQIVPVGYIYVEYYNQPSPQNLWPTWEWQDITSSFAGMFFRALGGNSSEWGEIQNCCSPRITKAEYDYQAGTGSGNFSILLPENGWSQYIYAGAWFTGGDKFEERLRFHGESCETRPTNQAIRIWKRVA